MTFLLAMLIQAAAPVPGQEAQPQPLPPLHGGPAPMTCPVGGESFSAWQPGAWSTYGERPDGRPYSYLPMPFPVPECPGNKLVVFDKFSAEEIAQLPELLRSEEYRRLVVEDTAYYRAAWLAARLGRSAKESLGLLLTASWEGKDDLRATDTAARARERAVRYNAEFARRVAALPASEREVWMDARAVNALREAGRFGAAESLRMVTLRQYSVAARGNWTAYLERLAGPIARRDRSPEPLDAVPPQQVAFLCISREGSLNSFDAAFCARPEHADDIARIRAQRAKMQHN
ncbi:hypothetical protein [Sphingomonas aracearum]|uniref:Uncharacterized protein n=1 Tax=Sphingomonas aracearum TaxID=2283317 RepID=A0A369VXV8_9SPHN|nr:hypothetical protein [Sphingomonas aracearum]RDE06447.1 hypothetical protein DVW87_01650 [Sphingomonas aracearum]